MQKQQPKILDAEFGTRLRLARCAKRFSQEKLGEIVDVSGAAISSWECGIEEPRPYRWPAIAAAVDMTVEDLFRVDSLGRPLVEHKEAQFEIREPADMKDVWMLIAKMQNDINDLKRDMINVHAALDELRAACRPRKARKT